MSGNPIPLIDGSGNVPVYAFRATYIFRHNSYRCSFRLMLSLILQTTLAGDALNPGQNVVILKYKRAGTYDFTYEGARTNTDRLWLQVPSI